ncbi:AAA family ATPase [Lactovum odontotermitis]
MKITKLEVKGHPVLKDFSLDFTNSLTGQAYNNIVFAGENGRGKTTILEILSEMRWLFLSGQNNGSLDLNNRFPYEITLSLETGVEMTSNVNEKNPSLRKIVIHDEFRPEEHPMGKYLLNTIYSTVGIDYTFSESRNIQNRTVDSEQSNSDRVRGNRSESKIPQELNELFVSINNQDSVELSTWVDENPNKVVPNSEKHKRMRRFNEAFSKMFSDLEFKRISESQEVLFSKNGAEINLSNLSSGEKQIVFRGGYLLKDINIYQSPFVMIDEPEISLHPKWQEKIFEFYTSLFEGLDAQIFMATHSEYVVESALKGENSLVYILSSDGVRKINQSPVLGKITGAETNYIAFGTRAIEYHNQLYSELQTISKKEVVKEFDCWLEQHDIPKDRERKRTDKDKVIACTLCSYIRDEYHHPTKNNPYSEKEVKESISEMVKVLKEVGNGEEFETTV